MNVIGLVYLIRNVALNLPILNGTFFFHALVTIASDGLKANDTFNLH